MSAWRTILSWDLLHYPILKSPYVGKLVTLPSRRAYAVIVLHSTEKTGKLWGKWVHNSNIREGISEAKELFNALKDSAVTVISLEEELTYYRLADSSDIKILETIVSEPIGLISDKGYIASDGKYKVMPGYYL